MYIKNYTNNNFQTYKKVNTIFDLQDLEFKKEFQSPWSFYFDIKTDNWADVIEKYKITNKIEIYDECLEANVFVWYIRWYNITEKWIVRIYGNDDMWIIDQATTTQAWAFNKDPLTPQRPYSIQEAFDRFVAGTNNIVIPFTVQILSWLQSMEREFAEGTSYIYFFNYVRDKFTSQGINWFYSNWVIYVWVESDIQTVLQWSYRYDANSIEDNTIEWFEIKNNWDSYQTKYIAPWSYETLYIDIDVKPSLTKDIEIGNKKRVYIRWCDWLVIADYLGIIQTIEYKLSWVDFYNISVSNGKNYTWPYLKNTSKFLRSRLY